jgi:hypothetical protein
VSVAVLLLGPERRRRGEGPVLVGWGCKRVVTARLQGGLVSWQPSRWRFGLG